LKPEAARRVKRADEGCDDDFLETADLPATEDLKIS